MNKYKVEHILELINIDQERIKLAKKRQAAVWAHQIPDKWPIIMTGELTEKQKKIPQPNYKEAFYSSDLMLCAQMREFFASLNGHSDAVPSIRANMGTGTLISLLGLNQLVFPDKMPWLQSSFTKKQISKIGVNDIKVQGDFELGIKHMKYYQEILGDLIPIYCMDTQGPFDLAHLMLGDQIFTEIYDDPPFLHHLMELCLQLAIKGHELCKEVSGEPRDLVYHGNSLYGENMGIRICEDTSAIVGPKVMDEFIIPYTTRLAKHFSGAWVHYCGRNDALTERICAIPEVRGINFGLIPGKEKEHDFTTEMKLFKKTGKVYWGVWTLENGESGKDYLRRLHSWCKEGCLIPYGNYAINQETGFATINEALDFWYSL